MPSDIAKAIHVMPSIIEHRMEPQAQESRWDTDSGPFPMLSKESNYAFTSTTVRGVEKSPEPWTPFSPLNHRDRAIERMVRVDFREDRLQFHSQR